MSTCHIGSLLIIEHSGIGYRRILGGEISNQHRKCVTGILIVQPGTPDFIEFSTVPSDLICLFILYKGKLWLINFLPHINVKRFFVYPF